MECRKERVLSMAHLEDLHVSGYEVPQVLPDEIELVHVRLARPQSLALHQLHEHTTWQPTEKLKTGFFSSPTQTRLINLSIKRALHSNLHLMRGC